jgi:FdhD protein
MRRIWSIRADEWYLSTGSAPRPVVRHRRTQSESLTDHVIEEFPVALVFNGISHAVMMTTPVDLEDFALGFALTEGIVQKASDVFELEVIMHADSAEVHLTVAQQAFLEMKGKRRALAGRTGCGVCGIESIELLDLYPEPIRAPAIRVEIAPSAIERAVQTLPARQALMRETGGVHAAAWCNREGGVEMVFEDVGRHNALDKLIGRLVRLRIDMSDGFVFLSSRASYELVRKAARMNIPLLATISAPTSLAIDIAQRSGIRLLSFCRQDGFVEYTARV